VHWKVVRTMLSPWILTLPAVGLPRSGVPAVAIP
jgi:hypothetical protein